MFVQNLPILYGSITRKRSTYVVNIEMCNNFKKLWNILTSKSYGNFKVLNQDEGKSVHQLAYYSGRSVRHNVDHSPSI